MENAAFESWLLDPCSVSGNESGVGIVFQGV